jgi:hypothetical protein
MTTKFLISRLTSNKLCRGVPEKCSPQVPYPRRIGGKTRLLREALSFQGFVMTLERFQLLPSGPLFPALRPKAYHNTLLTSKHRKEETNKKISNYEKKCYM